MSFEIPTNLYTSDALASIALLLFLLIARLVAGRTLRHRENLPDQVVRRWTANVRNMLILVAVVGLAMIWAPQLRTFALSLTAVAVAIVVATKELILCLSGSAFRTFTRAYMVGDIVEIGASKGEVLDLNLFSSHLREFEEREGSMIATGRDIIVPHSLLFTVPSRVISNSQGGIGHRFTMTFEPRVDVFSLEQEIARAIHQAVNEEQGRSRRTNRKPISFNLDFRTTDLGKYRIGIEFKAEPGELPTIENAVACAVGSLVHEKTAVGKQTEG